MDEDAAQPVVTAVEPCSQVRLREAQRPDFAPPGPVTILIAVAGFLVLAGTSLRYNRPGPISLTLVVTAWGVAWLAAWLDRWPTCIEHAARWAQPFLSWVAIGLVLPLYAYRSLLEIRWQGLAPVWLAGQLVLTALVLGSYATGRGVPARWRFPLTALGMLLIGGWVVRQWSEPIVDVFRLQRAAARQLAHGVNPYAAEHWDIPWNATFDGPAVNANGHLRSFPYPPLSLLAVLPGAAVGDVRHVLLAAWVGTAWMAVLAARREGLPAGHRSEVMAVALLHYPMALRIIYNAWTEPLIGLALGGCLWGLAGGRRRLAGLLLGLVVGLKQFGFVAIPPLLATRRLRPRDLGIGLVVVVVATAPFVIWGPAAFRLGNLTYQTSSPYRMDSFSVLAALARWGLRVPSGVGLLASLALMVPVVRACRGRTTAQATLGAAVSLWGTFLLGKAAHANYLWLVAAMLAMTAMLAVASQDQADGQASSFTRRSA